MLPFPVFFFFFLQEEYQEQTGFSSYFRLYPGHCDNTLWRFWILFSFFFFLKSINMIHFFFQKAVTLAELKLQTLCPVWQAAVEISGKFLYQFPLATVTNYHHNKTKQLSSHLKPQNLFFSQFGSPECPNQYHWVRISVSMATLLPEDLGSICSLLLPGFGGFGNSLEYGYIPPNFKARIFKSLSLLCLRMSSALCIVKSHSVSLL